MKDIKILGASGGKNFERSPTTLFIRDDIIIDAGNIMALGRNVLKLQYVFLTHSHLDHIFELPFLIDNCFIKRKKPLIIYGLKETLDSLKEYIFNWKIWPDFGEIDLISNINKALIFREINFGDVIVFDDITIESIYSPHTVPCSGYIIKKENSSILFTSDTYKNKILWDRVNSDKTIKKIIIDVSFPSSFDALAKDSQHLTAALLKEELEQLERDDIIINVFHIKPSFYKQVVIELEILKLKYYKNLVILNDGDNISF